MDLFTWTWLCRERFICFSQSNWKFCTDAGAQESNFCCNCRNCATGLENTCCNYLYFICDTYCSLFIALLSLVCFDSSLWRCWGTLSVIDMSDVLVTQQVGWVLACVSKCSRMSQSFCLLVDLVMSILLGSTLEPVPTISTSVQAATFPSISNSALFILKTCLPQHNLALGCISSGCSMSPYREWLMYSHRPGGRVMCLEEP